MNKICFHKKMQFMLLVVFTQLISSLCLSSNSDEQLILKHTKDMHKYLTIKKEINFDEIKKQFKKIDNDFNELKEQINIEIKSRHIRAAPREKHQECVVSRRELNDLKAAIDSTMTNLSKNNVNCNFNSDSNYDCNELLKLIQCGINNIRNEYNKITKDNVSSKSYQNLLNLYETLNNKYLKIREDVKGFSDQKYKNQMNKLTSDMQIIAKQLRESNDIILTKTIDLCALQIHTGNIENSIKEYHNLMDNNKIISLPKIVGNVYTQIKNENIESTIKNLLNFIENIPHKCEQFTTYLSLILKMQEKSHINCYIDKFWNHLKISCNKRNSQYSATKITECPKNYIEDFNIQLQTIIKHIYGNCFLNAENAIQFIDELLTNDQKVMAYPIVFNEMKKRNGLNGYEIVLLGFRIQEIILTQKSENLTSIMQIKEELPSGVGVLMSPGAIRLKTKALSNSNFGLSNAVIPILVYSSFLLNILLSLARSNDLREYQDTECTNVINSTLIPSSCTESVDQYQDWIVRVHQRGRYFQFINVATAYSLGANMTKTFVSARFHDRQLWEIIPVSNGTSFYIKNKYYGNILGVDLPSKTETSNIKYICYQIQAFNQYTGDDFQQWEIKHKM